MSEDWLSPSVRETFPALNLVPRGTSSKEIPAEADARKKLVEEVWSTLTSPQQVFLNTWMHHGFNVRATCRALDGTPEGVSRTTVSRWTQEENFAFMQKIILAAKREELVSADALQLRADYIADLALEPKPILFKGIPTGYYEQELGVALSANEQLMKAKGMFKTDEQSTRVTVRIVNLAGADQEPAIDVTPDPFGE